MLEIEFQKAQDTEHSYGFMFRTERGPDAYKEGNLQQPIKCLLYNKY